MKLTCVELRVALEEMKEYEPELLEWLEKLQLEIDLEGDDGYGGEPRAWWEGLVSMWEAESEYLGLKLDYHMGFDSDGNGYIDRFELSGPREEEWEALLLE
jgi:hypothetical protein